MSGNQRSSHLIAYAIIDASVTSIPINGTFLQLSLFDPNGVAIGSGILPGECTRVQFGGTGYILAVDNSVTPTWQRVCQATPIIDVVLGGRHKVAVSSASAAITTGQFAIMFYA